MTLMINGQGKQFPAEITIKELLGIEKVKTPEYVTVQVNDEFVDRKEYEQMKLKDGDQVDFLYFMGGGQY